MDTGNEDMRNQILAEIIDKMHERMASKMFPDISHGDNEAASAEGKPAVMAMGGLVPEAPLSTEPSQAKQGERLPDNPGTPEGKMDFPMTDPADSQEEDDAELMQELMKQHGV